MSPSLSSSERLLHEAATQGDPDAVTAALKAGAEVDAVDRDGATALLLAARGRHYEVVRLLIARGADLDRQDRGHFNAFIHACIVNDVALATLMVQAGCDLTRVTRYGGTGLVPASERANVEVIRYLLENTAIAVNAVNNLGWTALIEAIILTDGGQRAQKTVRLLLEHGADPRLADGDGATPLALARKHGHREIAGILERHLAS